MVFDANTPSTFSTGDAPAVFSFCCSSRTELPVVMPPAPTTGWSDVPGPARRASHRCRSACAARPRSRWHPRARRSPRRPHGRGRSRSRRRCSRSEAGGHAGPRRRGPAATIAGSYTPLMVSRGVAPTALSFCCAKATSAWSAPGASTARTGGGRRRRRRRAASRCPGRSTPFAGCDPVVVWNSRTAASRQLGRSSRPRPRGAPRPGPDSACAAPASPLRRGSRPQHLVRRRHRARDRSLALQRHEPRDCPVAGAVLDPEQRMLRLPRLVAQRPLALAAACAPCGCARSPSTRR